MQERRQTNTTTTLVGMDLHSEKVQLCVTRWTHGADPVRERFLCTTVAALEATYRRQVPEGAVTVLEASTNAFSVARRLGTIGFEARVLVSDIAAGLSARDRINDRIDAYNIAVAYARRGASRTEVFVPSVQYQDYRTIWFAYRNAVKDSTRLKNRIWAFCSEHGLEELARVRTADPARIRKAMEARDWSADRRFPLDGLLDALQFARSMRERTRRRIAEIVAGTPAMRKAMTVLGVADVTAFALMAFVERIDRFQSPKKLCSYLALNPTVRSSGKSEGGHRLSNRGRADLKALLVEGAQSALRYGREPMHRWARRKVASGKMRNVVVAALARRMAVVLWHALMGHPTPCREPEANFRRKLAGVGRNAGVARLKALGFASVRDYVSAIADPIYAHLKQKEEPSSKGIA